MRDNRIYNNFAASLGGGVFIDDGANVPFLHSLVYSNRSLEGGAGIFVDGLDETTSSTAVIDQSTIADNGEGPGDGNGLSIRSSNVTVRNSILWANRGDDFSLDQDSTLTVDFSLSQESWPAGIGNLHEDPGFADPNAANYHLLSTSGRYDPATGQWVNDPASSPAIDRGDPAAPFAEETAPNGGRVNLGAFGNTRLASRSDGSAARYLLEFSKGSWRWAVPSAQSE